MILLINIIVLITSLIAAYITFNIIDYAISKVGLVGQGFKRYGEIVEVINAREYKIKTKHFILGESIKTIKLRYVNPILLDVKLQQELVGKQIAYFKIKYNFDGFDIKKLSTYKILYNPFRADTYTIHILEDNSNMPNVLKPRYDLAMTIIDKDIIYFKETDIYGLIDYMKYKHYIIKESEDTNE